MTKNNLVEKINNSYAAKGEVITLGAAKYLGKVYADAKVNFPLSMINRHGLIAGATGTGKTKTLQIIAELLSEKGVPSICMDIKGDLSGIAVAGDQENKKIHERHEMIGIPFNAKGSPVEIMSISDGKGVKVRSTVSEFGPLLLSKILNLSEVQETITALVFKYADDNNIPLVDIEDFRAVLNYISEEGKEEISKRYGSFSTQSVGAILRKLMMLEQQKGNEFFAEPSFEVIDFLRTNLNGNGYVNMFRFMDMQDRPQLFSTFMLQILAEIFSVFPEAGDLDKPKLVVFIDEAHLIFKDSNKALINQLETTLKLIRSKGVGIFFCTQSPSDIPDAILGQLGFKIQHSLRAFTARDYENIAKTAKNFPRSEFYNIGELLTNMGVGEALITGLTEKGLMTEAVYTYLRAPMSRMDVLTDIEIEQIITSSRLFPIYNVKVDRKTAEILLKEKMEASRSEEEFNKKKDSWTAVDEAEREKTRSSMKKEKSTLETILSSPFLKQIGNTFTREVTRNIFGVLGTKSKKTGK